MKKRKSPAENGHQRVLDIAESQICGRRSSCNMRSSDSDSSRRCAKAIPVICCNMRISDRDSSAVDNARAFALGLPLCSRGCCCLTAQGVLFAVDEVFHSALHAVWHVIHGF